MIQHQYGAQIRQAFSRLPLVAGLPGGYHTNSADALSEREPSEARRRLGAIGRSMGGRGRWGADLHREQNRFGRGRGDGRRRLG